MPSLRAKNHGLQAGRTRGAMGFLDITIILQDVMLPLLEARDIARPGLLLPGAQTTGLRLTCSCLGDCGQVHIC